VPLAATPTDRPNPALAVDYHYLPIAGIFLIHHTTVTHYCGYYHYLHRYDQSQSRKHESMCHHTRRTLNWAQESFNTQEACNPGRICTYIIRVSGSLCIYCAELEIFSVAAESAASCESDMTCCCRARLPILSSDSFPSEVIHATNINGMHAWTLSNRRGKIIWNTWMSHVTNMNV